MEVREILVANTRTQKRSKITTAATTLGELKAALAEAGVDYSGMTFTEGISKTQLLDDATQLPQNVMYKGSPTNNLVILLTNTKKNIASGSGDRAAVYSAIKDNGLQDAVKEHFGRNFTQVPTQDLWEFIGFDRELEVKPEPKEEVLKEKEEMECTDIAEAKTSTKIASGIFFMITHFGNAGLLPVMELRNLAKNIMVYAEESYKKETDTPSEPVSTSDGSITDEDIDDMIDSIV